MSEPRFRSHGMPARLAEIRKERGLSQNALAKAAGLTHPTIIRLEEGTSSPSLDTLERVAMALEVSPCWLAYGIGGRRMAGKGRPIDG